MAAKPLLLALLFGAVGGVLAAWAVSASGGDAPAKALVHAEEEVARIETGDAPAVERGQERGLDPGPTLVGSPHAARSDATWREGLEQRLTRIEAQLKDLAQQAAARDQGTGAADLEALSDEELTARASSMYTFRNYAGTLEAYEALLARDPDLDVKTRSEVLSAIAQCHRALGDPMAADEVLRQVEALHGAGTAGAMTARYQRAWLRHAEKDLEGAREYMREVASSENTPRFWRLFSRANAADFSIRLGDTAHVRSDLEEFKAELEGDDSQTGRRVLNYVTSLLETLND